MDVEVSNLAVSSPFSLFLSPLLLFPFPYVLGTHYDITIGAGWSVGTRHKIKKDKDKAIKIQSSLNDAK